MKSTWPRDCEHLSTVITVHHCSLQHLAAIRLSKDKARAEFRAFMYMGHDFTPGHSSRTSLFKRSTNVSKEASEILAMDCHTCLVILRMSSCSCWIGISLTYSDELHCSYVLLRACCEGGEGMRQSAQEKLSAKHSSKRIEWRRKSVSQQTQESIGAKMPCGGPPGQACNGLPPVKQGRPNHSFLMQCVGVMRRMRMMRMPMLLMTMRMLLLLLLMMMLTMMTMMIMTTMRTLTTTTTTTTTTTMMMRMYEDVWWWWWWWW